MSLDITIYRYTAGVAADEWFYWALSPNRSKVLSRFHYAGMNSAGPVDRLLKEAWPTLRAPEVDVAPVCRAIFANPASRMMILPTVRNGENKNSGI